MNIKGFIPVLILVVALLGIFGYFVVKNGSLGQLFPSSIYPDQSSLPSPAPDTADLNWQKYTSDKYGIEFEYPTKCSVVVANENEINISTPNQLYAKCNDLKSIVEVTVLIASENTNVLDPYADGSLTQYFNIGDIEAIRRFVPVDFNRREHPYVPSSDVLFFKDGVSYYLLDSSSDSQFLDRILSTFKFTR